MIEGADAAGANYITWAPVHSSIRLVESDGGADFVDVLLQNQNPGGKGGQILFLSAIPAKGQDRLQPPEKAIQLLGYDIHAEHYPILREIVQDPPSPEAKAEAVRLLAADPTSEKLLTERLQDKGEDREVRIASAVALQSLAPAEFQEQAKQIVYDPEEYTDLRATAINALTLFGNQEALDQDAELTRRVEQLSEESPSENVTRTANRFLRRQRRRRERRSRSEGARGERG